MGCNGWEVERVESLARILIVDKDPRRLLAIGGRLSVRNASILFVVLNILAGLAWAHGEEKLGPHGGYIKMPGAFHTELVLDGAHKVKVYLLDFDWKNPSVRDSSVSLTLHGRGRATAKCVKQDDNYACEFSPIVDLGKKGALVLQAEREKQKGQSVRYELPLTLSSGDNGRDKEHGQHH